MHRTIVEAVTAHAGDRPGKCALTDSNVTFDYGALDRFSTRVAGCLHQLGCRPGDRVVMLANRRAILVAATFGVFKAGCIHVPLDPQMPAARLRYILEDIAPALVITEPTLTDALPLRTLVQTNVLSVSVLQQWLADDDRHGNGSAAAVPLGNCQPDDLACCIYASGLTGRPRGVVIDHRSIVDFFDGARDVYDVGPHAVCASFSPLHFNVFLMDMLLPLAAGARLHVYDDVVVPDPAFEIIWANKVTHFSAWGTMLGLIAQAAEFDTVPLPHLKTVLTGADVPDVEAVQRWLRKNSGVQVINAYGPTEATCAATAHVIRDIEPECQEPYPIGKPLKHVQAFLIGKQGERIDAAHVPGELLIGGTQVMRGYWNLPDETSARSMWLGGVMCYRTGDICSYLADGSLFYIGRKNNEVLERFPQLSSGKTDRKELSSTLERMHRQTREVPTSSRWRVRDADARTRS